MYRSKRYLDPSAFSYSDAFTARFPWEVKQDVFVPLLNYIETLALKNQRFHHFISDLKYLNTIFNFRYVNGHYSFSYALPEYEYMIDMFRYLYVFYDNDEKVLKNIHTLQKMLAEEINFAQTGYLYRPCSCGSSCMVNEEFNKKVLISKSYK